MKRILVPLDLNSEPYSVLGLVADAGHGAGATVCLLHVAPVPESVVDAAGRTIAYASQEGARLEAEALDRLHPLEAQLDGIPVELAVRFGDAADEILACADDFGADLIAFAVPADRGLSRATLCSTIARVWSRATAAVVLLRQPAVCRRLSCDVG
jgi:nucleotide-binding universal stress UspA family protein